MLGWALTFLVIAIIAGLLGFGGIAGASAGIAKILFLIFIVLFVIAMIARAVRGRPPMCTEPKTRTRNGRPLGGRFRFRCTARHRRKGKGPRDRGPCQSVRKCQLF